MNFIQKLASFIRNPTTYYLSYYGNNTPVWIEDNTEAYVKQGYCGSSDVYSIIKRKIDLAQSIPWKVQQKKGNKWVDVSDHPLQALIENPNPAMSQAEFIASALGYYELTGNSYIWAPRLENGINKGKTDELWTMPSQLIGIIFGNISNPIKGYHYLRSPNEIINPFQVCHVKTWNPDSNGYAFYGLSPLRAGKKNLTMAHSAMKANVKSFDNMGPGGIVARDGEEFTQDQANNLQNRWDGKYTGPENAKRLVLTGASIKYHQIGLSPVDLNILEREKYNMGQLCNLWGMPVQVFNNTDQTAFNNMDAALKIAYTHGVLPGLYAIRDGLNRWLAPSYGENIWLTPDLSGIEVLQSNKKEMVEWLKEAWWIKGSRKQAIMGEEEDKELDKYFLPTSIIPSDQLNDEDVEEAIKQLDKQKINDYE